jgi:hypothetical protein
MGESPKHVSNEEDGYGRLPFVTEVSMSSTESTEDFFGGASVPFDCRVIDVWAVMTGAGDSSDTYVVSQVRGATTTAITDTVDVSSAGDRDIVRAGEINDASSDLQPGDFLRCTTADNALVRVYVMLMRINV